MDRRAGLITIESVEVKTSAELAAFEFGQTGDFGACDDGQAIAGFGETWVLDSSRRPDGGGGAEEADGKGAVAGGQGRAGYAGGDHAGQQAGRGFRSGPPLPP